MTYCCGILVREGLVMVADSRTNAGLDNIANYRKLHVFTCPDKYVMALSSAGNLSISQAVLSILQEGFETDEEEERQTLQNSPTMFQAAQRVGRAIRQVYEIDGPGLEASKIPFDVSFLLGGQIEGGPMRLFMIYAAGNFIECTPDTPYLQIGEHKYGKPILDRAIQHDSDLSDALKIALISMDSTMRSNLSVGMPIDLVVVQRDSLNLQTSHRIDGNDKYFFDLRERWSAALRAAHMAIPKPTYSNADKPAKKK